MHLNFGASRVAGALLVLFIPYCSRASAQTNNILGNGMRIIKQYKHCKMGTFYTYNVTAKLNDGEDGVYHQWSQPFEFSNSIFEDICESASYDRLEEAEIDLVRKEVDAANGCAEKMASYLTFRQFASAVPPVQSEEKDLMSIRGILSSASDRSAQIGSTTDLANKTFMLLDALPGFPGKKMAIERALASHEVRELIREAVKDKIEDETKEFIVEKIDPFAFIGNIVQQYFDSNSKLSFQVVICR